LREKERKEGKREAGEVVFRKKSSPKRWEWERGGEEKGERGS
jgi:hypothetical protein